MISEDSIDNKLKDITRHIVAHECFDEIYIGQNPARQEYDIECQCGKRWTITTSDMTRCNIEAGYIVNFINGFNTQKFHEKLIEIKESGAWKTEESEELQKKVQSPTISSLEF